MIPIEIPYAFRELFTPCRLKVFHGGRGGAKSESVGRYLLAVGASEPMKIVCAREYQNSIKDSVHEMLAELIAVHGLSDFYQVLKTEIRGKNGTSFAFVGLHHNIANIKSMYDVKKFWVEEAETVSDASWKVIFPTIRAKDSEIIATFNPDLPDSPTYQRLVANPPPYAIVRKVNYDQNPYFPDVLRQEMEHCKATDPEEYRNVWLGECRAAVAGAVFAKEIGKAVEEQRITEVRYDPLKPVNTYWDLGRNDKTAVWFMQTIGGQFRFIRYYENSGEHFSHYIKYLKELPYAYGNHYLPHDAANELLGQEKSILNQMRSVFSGVQEPIQRTPRKALAIDAARSIMGNSWWDRENCADGIVCLQRYAYKFDPETQKTSPEPEHDTPWSHGADAFQCAGMAAQLVEKKKQTKPRRSIYAGVHG